MAISLMDNYIQKYKNDQYDIYLHINTGRLVHAEELIMKANKVLQHTVKFMHYIRFRNAATVVLCATKWLHAIKT